ncbi:MAG: hypothetical protein JEZ09_05115 [Salinivirgaceae bacterium]|nr:hypothetical protein [Salinivirgaceae bacterium]
MMYVIKQLFLKKSILFYLIVVCCTVFGSSQTLDYLHINSDNYYALPYNIGGHSHNWVISNYINSQRLLPDHPVQSFLLSGDYQIASGDDKLSVGGAISYKKLISSPLVDNEIFTTLAYHKNYRNNQFHIAIQPSLFYRSLDFSSLLFPDQYDRETGSFNTLVATNENLLANEKKVGINVNAGIAWTRYFANFYSQFGVNVRNVLAQKSSVSELKVPQYFQFILSSKTNYFLNKNQTLKPFVIYNSSAILNELAIGSDIKHGLGYNFFKVNSIWAGTYLVMRTKKYPNDIVFNVGAQVSKFQFGFAYSFNLMGKKNKISTFNIYELTIAYLGLNRLIENYRIPCTIY